MSAKRDREIEQKADSVIWALKDRGASLVMDNGSGIASRVAARVRALCQGSDLVIKDPTFRGDGEYDFRSASHLGTKTGEGAS